MHLIDQAQIQIGAEFDARIDLLRVINEAGDYLCSMHEWPWLRRPSVLLDFVAEQPYIELPADFHDILSIQSVFDTLRNVRRVGREAIDRLRGAAVDPPFDYYVALEYPPQTDTASRPPKPRLNLYPVPEADEPGVLRLAYEAGWTRLDDLTDVPNIPSDCDALLIELIRAHARFYAGQAATLSEAVEPVERGTMLRRLKERYGAIDRRRGHIRGGVVPERQNRPRGPNQLYETITFQS